MHVCPGIPEYIARYVLVLFRSTKSEDKRTWFISYKPYKPCVKHGGKQYMLNIVVMLPYVSCKGMPHGTIRRYNALLRW